MSPGIRCCVSAAACAVAVGASAANAGERGSAFCHDQATSGACAADGVGAEVVEADDGDVDEATRRGSAALRELGVDALADALGRRPVSAEEHRIVPILHSIGEGDYGEIARLCLEFAPGDGARECVIVKRVVPKDEAKVEPTAVGAVEHRRFMRSFLVEVEAYRSFAEPLAALNASMPRLHLVSPPRPRVGEHFTMVMEDLSRRFPRGSGGEIRRMTQQEIEAALRWLAALHASFWEMPPGGLFERGCYWVLDELCTLQLAGVPEGYGNRYLEPSEWRRLRAAAPAVAARLAGRSATASLVGEGGDAGSALVLTKAMQSRRYLTVLHGDAKPENILCSHRGGPGRAAVECAGIDFGFAGGGYGACDVVYLLWGELAVNVVDQHLEHYHAALLERLPPDASSGFSMAVLRRHVDLCTLDFIRWMPGYKAGDYFWAMPWAMSILRDTLDRLDGGRLLSQEAYAQAVDREYPLD